MRSASFPLAIHLPLEVKARPTFAAVALGMTLKLAAFAAGAASVLAALMLGRGVDLPLNRLRRREFK